MAEQVVWTARAEKDRKEILSYWIERNGSAAYSLKLHGLFQTAIGTIAQFPLIGRPTDLKGIRVKLVRDYGIFY